MKSRSEADRVGHFGPRLDAGELRERSLFRDMLLVASVAVLAIVLGLTDVFAGEADVVDAKARKQGDTWAFDVTVRHDDAGWNHYADKWAVFAPDGTQLGERVLLHPHDNEQPFTRSLSGVEIPDGVTNVIIRAHDSVHEWGGAELSVDLIE